MKTIKLKTKPTITEYLNLVNGIFSLTGAELNVLSKFVQLSSQYPELYVFSADIKKQVAKELNLSNFNTLNIYIKNLKDKKALIYKSKKYSFHPIVDYKNIEQGIGFVWTVNN